MQIAFRDHLIPVRFHSARRRLALVCASTGVEVRAPAGCDAAVIERFVQAHSDWIEHALRITEARRHYLWGEPSALPLTRERARMLLRPWLRARLAHWQPRMRAAPEKVTLRAMRSRWGSCSTKGHLSFALSLVQLPQAVADSVVVHELAHLHEMNHGAAFWRHVAAVMPDYAEKRRQLAVWGQKIAFL